MNTVKGLSAVCKELSQCAAHPALLTDFLPKDDLLERPHRNLFRSVSSFPSASLGHVSLNENRHVLSTACSVLKLLLSHSGRHGPVVSY